MKYLLLSLLFFVNQAFAWGWGSTNEQRVEYQSFTTPTMFSLAREKRAEWKPVKISAVLTLPKTASAEHPVPVILLSHGSSGVGRHEQQWVEAFAELGVGSLVIDSFGPRGITSMMADQSKLSTSANLMDAFKGLEYLAADPRVDSKRIGVMGFSKGGEVALRSAIEPLRAAVIKSELRFALHIPMYPGCNQVYFSPSLTKSPILTLLGTTDDYSLYKPCETLAEKYEKAGANIKVIEYEGAPHGWDSLVRVVFDSSITTASSCGPVIWTIETWDIVSERTGQHFKGNEVDPFLSSCAHTGAHVGRNEAAYKKSRADVQAFVSQVFQVELSN